MNSNLSTEGFEFLQDGLVANEIENIGFRNLVKKKFEELNMGIEENVMPIMKETQDVFDEILKDVDQLEAQEKILCKELHSLIAADVIVLDDDDDLEAPKEELKVPEPLQTSSTMGSPSRANADARLRIPKPEAKSEILGLYTGLRVLAKKRTQWFPATIIDVIMQDNKKRYKVRYDMNRGKSKVLANHLAWLDTSQRYTPGQIAAGSRIAAHFKDDGIFSGIIAETADRKKNKMRYLIFYDDGYTNYCPVNAVYLVCSLQSVNVWEDISHRHTAEYIQEYLSTSERPMLTMKPNQILKVEFQGEWHKAKCSKVDCSLVEVMYLSDNSREWIYRGSLRLEPLYKQSHSKMKAMQNKSQRKLARAHTGVRNAHIEYAMIDLTRDSSPSPTNSPTRDSSRSQLSYKEMEDRKKNVGKKSTGGIPRSHTNHPDVPHSYKQLQGGWKAPWVKSLAAQKPQIGNSPVTRLPQSFTEFRGGVDVASHILDRMSMSKIQRENLPTIGGGNGKGGLRSKSLDDSTDGDLTFGSNVRMDSDRRRMVFGARSTNYFMMAPRHSALYTKHICSSKCVEPFKVADPAKLKGINPLMKPLLLGWTREVSRKHPCSRSPAFHVYYRTPCGRMCRNMEDVDRYMIETNLMDLDYDQFCFDFSVRTQSNIAVHSRDAKLFIEDYAEGKEDIPIPCVNEINAEKPPKMPYTKERIAGKGVAINTSPDFMVCCDCDNNCRDRSKCPCQQLTVTATSCCKVGDVKEKAGYSYKRLYNFLPTGIYECNAKCKCNMGCPNRVVQKGLQCKLQMFKTHKKGWGIRCLDDIAKGTFVCIYTGKIQNEEQANQEGLANGDEYLAELDHIEVAERQKDVEDEASSSGIDSDMDDEEDDEKGNDRDKNEAKNCDSGASTTDSEADNDIKQKHLTVTLQRANDSKWTVKSDEKTSPPIEEEDTGKNNDYKKDSFGIGKLPSVRRKSQNVKLGAVKCDSSDSEIDVTPACPSQLAPPGGGNGNEDDDDDTTDTDTDFSNNDNSRPPSASGSSSVKNQDRRSSQGISLHSSKMGSDGKLDESSDEEDHVSQTRRYFGCTDTFTIDAKQTGNLGRYLNHSCSPNLLVQNVFIDTHDLRFPWVAFFATSTIRAGTELTWDYNYEIGSVEGREIQCYCGATKCRKRLL